MHMIFIFDVVLIFLIIFIQRSSSFLGCLHLLGFLHFWGCPRFWGRLPFLGFLNFWDCPRFWGRLHCFKLSWRHLSRRHNNPFRESSNYKACRLKIICIFPNFWEMQYITKYLKTCFIKWIRFNEFSLGYDVSHVEASSFIIMWCSKPQVEA